MSQDTKIRAEEEMNVGRAMSMCVDLVMVANRGLTLHSFTQKCPNLETLGQKPAYTGLILGEQAAGRHQSAQQLPYLCLERGLGVKWRWQTCRWHN